jgi:hypothetical protein
MKVFIRLSSATAALILIASLAAPAHASGIAGSKCPQSGASLSIGNTKFTCSKSNTGLKWTVVPINNGARKTTPTPTPTMRPMFKPVFTVTSDEKVSQTKFGSCTALLPAGYSTTTNAQGTAGEFASPDKKFYGAWYIKPVNTSELWAESDKLYGIDPLMDSADPETQIMATANYSAKALGYTGDFSKYGSSISSNGYTGFEARSSTSRAILIYMSPAIQGDGISYDYMAIGRIAIAPLTATDKQLDLLARQALSIQCTTKYSTPSTSSAFTSTSHSSAKSGQGPAPTDQEENATLGTVYVTDQSTGDLYNLPLQDWSQDPCGTGSSGWAVPSGNSCKVVGH